MKHMGYAVSPGTHASFSLKYLVVSFLCGTGQIGSLPNQVIAKQSTKN